MNKEWQEKYDRMWSEERAEWIAKYGLVNQVSESTVEEKAWIRFIRKVVIPEAWAAGERWQWDSKLNSKPDLDQFIEEKLGA